MLKVRNNLEWCRDNVVKIEKMLENQAFVAKIGTDTAENRLQKGLQTGTLSKAPMVTRCYMVRAQASTSRQRCARGSAARGC